MRIRLLSTEIRIVKTLFGYINTMVKLEMENKLTDEILNLRF